MLDDVFRRSRVRQRIRQNPQGAVLEQFAEYLIARGHGPGTVHQYVFAAEHFGRWLGSRRIDRQAVVRFLKRHLPSCRCKKPASRESPNVCAALNRLLEMIGSEVGAPAKKSLSDALLRQYADHLNRVQGLAPVTVHYRVRYARNMLLNLRVRRVGQLKRWTVGQVRRFVIRQGRRCRASSGQVMASSIRSFLRFLLLRQLIDRDLAAAVPAFANWRLAPLPTTVSGEELERLVHAISRKSPVGLRDRAIVLCLVELGLRASDVAGLDLDCLDLSRRILSLRRYKQRQSTTVPISRRVAAAISNYVRQGRPTCSTSALFVCHRAPRGKAMTPIGVRGVVVRSAAQVGLADRIRGTHVIRHSVASHWIQAGATLKQIADLLGHRSIDTTRIYAKVDLLALVKVALPWPTSREVMP
jgi:site-specific recombinase XerD